MLQQVTDTQLVGRPQQTRTPAAPSQTVVQLVGRPQQTRTPAAPSQTVVPQSHSPVGVYWEMCCSSTSVLTDTARRHQLRCQRLTIDNGFDFSKKAVRDATLRALDHVCVLGVWFSPPCTAWSSIQNFNRVSPALLRKRRESRQLLRLCFAILLKALRQGSRIYFEWPARCQGWKVKEVVTFKRRCARILKRPLTRVRLDGCMYKFTTRDGHALLRKPWVILTNDDLASEALGRVCDGSHTHKTIMGQETSRSAYYPPALAEAIVSLWDR